MHELIPAILAKDADTFRERLSLMEGLVQTIQLDCMDGSFVENRTWHEATPINSTLEIELHLMVSDPLAVIEDWKRVKNVVRALWHIEIPTDHKKMITRCRELGWECGLALSPEAPIERLSNFADEIDEVLVLGVNPGWSRQTLIPSTMEKVRELTRRYPDLIIGFDGGITHKNTPLLIEAGVDRFCEASAIFDAPDPRAATRAILASI